jgi:D-glycero-beta-D-manno-heptose 1-phosphate adenylyltransferase
MKHSSLVKHKKPSTKLNSYERVITNYNQIKSLVQGHKKNGLKIVLTQGTFDMIHVGHGRYLKAAKSHGDILIVGVDSDKKVRQRKGPDRPVIPQDERLEMLTHLRHVDVVFLKELAHKKWALIKAIRPDVLVAIKENYNAKQLKELRKYCGKVVVMERQATTSTSAKIRLLQIGAAQKLEKALTPRLLSVIKEVLAEVK